MNHPCRFPLINLFSLCAHIRLQWKIAYAWHLPCCWDFSLPQRLIDMAMLVLFCSKVIGMESCPAPFMPRSAGMACVLFVMYLLSFWDSQSLCRWLTLLSGHAQLWFSHAVQPWFSEKQHSFCGFLTSLFNPSFLSFSLSIDRGL